MTVYISMLRGINVGGQKQVRMEILRSLYKDLGFTGVKTYVQSGNVIFESAEQNPAILVKQIEAQIEQSFGFTVAVFIRNCGEIQRILATNPFINNKNEDASKLHVSFLYQPSLEPAWSASQSLDTGPDEFAWGESVIYLYCPNGYGKTRLSNSFFEKKLGMPVTTRNWNTVNAIHKMAIEETH